MDSNVFRKFSNKKPHLNIGVGLVVFALVAFTVWFVVLKKGTQKILSPFSRQGKDGWSLGNIDEVINPMTGEKVNKKDAPWYESRPFAVMINNHTDARPQANLINADLVYEIVAEGGITRFLAFFESSAPEKIGPVRSTREYYLVLVKELGDAAIMHIGWSPQALTAIETWPVRSLARGGATFWRENPKNVATEHTAYVNGKDLRALMDKLGWSGVGEFRVWKFKDNAKKYESSPAATEVTIDFWYKGDYSAGFKYNPQANSYLRFTGYDSNNQLVSHIDQITGKQLEYKNVIVQFVSEVPIAGDDKNRLTYELTGSGEGLVFIDGKVTKVTWSKESRDARTLFYDLNGKEIEFNRGKFWISAVPDRNKDQTVYK